RKLTPHGVELILDMVGGPYTLRNIEALAMHGRLVQIAVQQGAEATINLAKIMQKRLIVTGSTMRPRSVDDKGRIASELHERVWPLLESGAVKVIVDRVFPFDDVAGAHRYLESGAHIGKVILKVVGPCQNSKSASQPPTMFPVFSAGSPIRPPFGASH